MRNSTETVEQPRRWFPSLGSRRRFRLWNLCEGQNTQDTRICGRNYVFIIRNSYEAAAELSDTVTGIDMIWPGVPCSTLHHLWVAVHLTPFLSRCYWVIQLVPRRLTDYTLKLAAIFYFQCLARLVVSVIMVSLLFPVPCKIGGLCYYGFPSFMPPSTHVCVCVCVRACMRVRVCVRAACTRVCNGCCEDKLSAVTYKWIELLEVNFWLCRRTIGGFLADHCLPFVCK